MLLPCASPGAKLVVLAQRIIQEARDEAKVAAAKQAAAERLQLRLGEPEGALERRAVQGECIAEPATNLYKGRCGCTVPPVRETRLTTLTNSYHQS